MQAIDYKVLYKLCKIYKSNLSIRSNPTILGSFDVLYEMNFSKENKNLIKQSFFFLGQKNFLKLYHADNDIHMVEISQNGVDFVKNIPLKALKSLTSFIKFLSSIM